VNFVFFLIAAIFLCGCVENKLDIDCKKNIKSRLVNEIGNRVFIRLKEDKNLHLCECGGRMMDQITLLHLGFDYFKQINIEEARELLVKASVLFLKIINEDEQIRPFLKNFPFLSTNIEIRIFLHTSYNSQLDSKQLCVITLLNGYLHYKIHNPETSLLTTIYTETFEEAIEKLAIVNSEEIPSVNEKCIIN
jgi:hypothetical protein